MSESIPPIDPDLKPDDATQNLNREKLEYELLEKEAAIKSLAHREIGQRYLIKWVAVFTGVAVIVGMALALRHLVHKAFR